MQWVLHAGFSLDGQNRHDQITSDWSFKSAWSNCVLCIPFIFSGSPNKCWLHTCDACVIITTWRLGLRAPLVTGKKVCYRAMWQKLSFKRLLSQISRFELRDINLKINFRQRSRFFSKKSQTERHFIALEKHMAGSTLVQSEILRFSLIVYLNFFSYWVSDNP